MAQMSQLETNLSRVFYLGAALTGLFAGEMVFAPGAALRNHFGIEHPTTREQEIAKAFAYSAAAGTAFALMGYHVAPTLHHRRNLVKLAAATMLLPVAWHAQDEMRGAGRKALDPPMRRMEMGAAAAVAATMAYFGFRA